MQVFENIHNRQNVQYKCNMKKIFYVLPAIAAAAAVCGGCKVKTDYREYVSERRYDIYEYTGDDVKISMYCTEKESPFIADGIKDDTCKTAEIYADVQEAENVTVTSQSFTGGEMSYLAARGVWYISFSCEAPEGSEIKITLERDGEKQDYTLLSVLTDGVMTCEQALDCVMEHDGELFEKMTENGIFKGEIIIRLLYDDKCYYYVGVCDREGNMHAYLADGQSGRIISERTHSM